RAAPAGAANEMFRPRARTGSCPLHPIRPYGDQHAPSAPKRPRLSREHLIRAAQSKAWAYHTTNASPYHRGLGMSEMSPWGGFGGGRVGPGCHLGSAELGLAGRPLIPNGRRWLALVLLSGSGHWPASARLNIVCTPYDKLATVPLYKETRK